MYTAIITALLPLVVSVLGNWLERRFKQNKIKEETWKSFLDFKQSIEKDLNDASKLRDSTKDQIDDLKSKGLE